jgi:hypothetical protein
MRRSIPIIALVLMLFLVLPCWGEKDWPMTLNLTREDGLEQYIGFCSSVAADKIECEF